MDDWVGLPNFGNVFEWHNRALQSLEDSLNLRDCCDQEIFQANTDITFGTSKRKQDSAPQTI
jgi:hypothetical protein